MRLGVNVSYADGTGIPTSDLMRLRTRWFLKDADAGYSQVDPSRIRWTPDDWPAELPGGLYAECYVLKGLDGKYPWHSVHALIRAGEGKVMIDFDAQKTEISGEFAPIIPLESKTDRGIRITILETSPHNPIRDIQLSVSDGGEGPPKSFVQALAPFSIVRLMNLQRTNNSLVSQARDIPDWSGSGRWTSSAGMPFEALEQISPVRERWACIPHMAKVSYTRELAKRLRPEWVEYTNEVWNSWFLQCHYLGGSSDLEALSTEYAFRAIAHLSIVPAHTKRVAGGWFASPTYSKLVALKLRGLATHLGVAPYFGRKWGSEHAIDALTMSLDDLISEGEKEITEEWPRKIQHHAEIAARFRMDLVAYEFGQDFTATGGHANNPELVDKFTELNRHERMGDLLTLALDTWKLNGGGDALLYDLCRRPTKFGAFGLVENLLDLDTPKMRAAVAYAKRLSSQ